MNKAITDGLVLMPPPFVNGLDVWSTGDGTPGSQTYATSGTGAFVPADANFAGCLEIVKTTATTKLRYMGETTILPGCYLQVRARVKAVSGPLPAVRNAGWAGGAGGAHVPGLTETAPSVQLTTYGEVVEVSAIIGTGFRTGVDMTWPDAIYGHLGLDLTGPNGGVVRIDDVEIEDVTNVFIRDMIGFVDVRDYGAMGDGVTDDSAAFEAADADAFGREVLVSEGTYFLGDHVTIENQIHFAGTVTMPDDKRLILQKNFDFETYFDAFQDEELAFKKSFQALLNFSDHDTLDLGGRIISLSAPVDMQAAEGAKTTFEIRRVIQNGQLRPVAGPNWDPDVVTSQATYSSATPYQLTNVANIANIAVGSLVEGNGVGREVYVQAVNVAQQSLTLSQQIYDVDGSQIFTFTRFKYLIDLSGFAKYSRLHFDNIEFYCDGESSAVMLGQDGSLMQFRDCYFNKPRNRGITSIARACQGMMIDRCEFISNEQTLPDQTRISVGVNANANDVKIRDCRLVRFKHFAVLGGTGSMIVGNHCFQGDNETDGLRQAGFIFTRPNNKTIFTGNYIDNCSIELTNEHDATPDLGAQYSFGGISITGNIFTAADVAPWFSWIVIKPHGVGQFIHGLSVSGNVFKALDGAIERAERIDTSIADLDRTRFRNVYFQNNTYTAVNTVTENPVSVNHKENSESAVWTVDTAGRLPFEGYARFVESVMPIGALTAVGGGRVYELPYSEVRVGPNEDQINLRFGTACKGEVQVRVRCDWMD